MSWVAIGAAAAALVGSLMQADAQGRSGSLGATTGGRGGQSGSYQPSIQSISDMITEASGGGQPKANIKTPDHPQAAVYKAQGDVLKKMADLTNKRHELEKLYGTGQDVGASSIENVGSSQFPISESPSATEPKGGGMGIGQIAGLISKMAPMMMQSMQSGNADLGARAGMAQGVPFTSSLAQLGQQQSIPYAHANLGGGQLDLQTLLALLGQRGLM